MEVNSYTVYLERFIGRGPFLRADVTKVVVEAASLDVALAEARFQKPGREISMFWLNWEPKR